MTTLHLYWSNPLYFHDLFNETYYNKIDQSEMYCEQGIYMIVGEREIIYVGKTYDQSFKTRLQQHRRSKKWNAIKKAIRRLPRKHPFIKCAYLRENYSRKRITEIENFLIFAEEPSCCDRDYATYNGRRPLLIINEGNYWPLQPIYYTEEYSEYM